VSVRTYLPTLKFVLEALCAYIAKHRTKILSVIGNDNVAKLDAVVTACQILTEAILPFIPGGV
jgi:hypothetical protein